MFYDLICNWLVRFSKTSKTCRCAILTPVIGDLEDIFVPDIIHLLVQLK